VTLPPDRVGEDRRPEHVDDPPEEGELVRLAENLQAAIASNDLGLALKAHHELGSRLERVDDDEPVIDLARERARQRGIR
jgi:hypothetical protein